MESSDLFVISVRHTGTRFTKQLLGGVPHCHLDKPSVFDKAKEYEGRTVVPIRDPRRVLESWHKRGEKLERFLVSWPRLMDLHKEHQFMFLPVDHPERRYFLDKLAERLERPLTTDWEPVTEHVTFDQQVPVPNVDLSLIYNFLLLEGIRYGTN